MSNSKIRISLMSLVILHCFACSARDPIPAAEVLKHGDCAISQSGMQIVSYADVARLRGSTLLNLTTPRVNQGPDLTLLAISNGRQPTPGYGFELIDAFENDATATIELRWVVPDESAVQPQITTHPCIVVGLERSGFTRVRAVDDQGNILAELSLP